MANSAIDSVHESEAPEVSRKRPSLELPNQPKSTSGRRSGGSMARWFLALGVVGVMGTAAYTLPRFSSLGASSPQDHWLTEPAARKRLILKVTEDGNIESASNIDVKCEVLGGSTILWIVEDGKRVEQDEVIVRLDQSAIETQLSTQKIATEKAEAIKIQAEQDYEAAKIAVEEYQKGTFVMDQQNLEASVKIALENLRAAENLYNHTESMFRKGFVTKQQLESDQFGMQRTELELKSAQTALKVLRDYTKDKMLTQLKATRDAAAARMRSEQAALDLEKSNLKKLEQQLAKCVILAPAGWDGDLCQRAGPAVLERSVDRGRGRRPRTAVDHQASGPQRGCRSKSPCTRPKSSRWKSACPPESPCRTAPTTAKSSRSPISPNPRTGSPPTSSCMRRPWPSKGKPKTSSRA